MLDVNAINSIGQTLTVLRNLVTEFGMLGVTMGSVLYAALEYRRAQKWKAADLASDLLRALHDDERLEFCCHALDWGVGPLRIPSQYRPYFEKDEAGAYPFLMEHLPSDLAAAVQPNLTESVLMNPRSLVYRLCFVRLFDHLERIGRLLESKKVQKEDLIGLEYLMGQLARYQYHPANSAASMFMPAIREWGYAGVDALGTALLPEVWAKARASARDRSR